MKIYFFSFSLIFAISLQFYPQDKSKSSFQILHNLAQSKSSFQLKHQLSNMTYLSLDDDIHNHLLFKNKINYLKSKIFINFVALNCYKSFAINSTFNSYYKQIFNCNLMNGDLNKYSTDEYT